MRMIVMKDISVQMMDYITWMKFIFTWMNLITQMQFINEFNMMNQISFMDEHEHLPCDFHMVNYICYAINLKNYLNLIHVFKIHPYDQISVICLIVSWWYGPLVSLT